MVNLGITLVNMLVEQNVARPKNHFLLQNKIIPLLLNHFDYENSQNCLGNCEIYFGGGVSCIFGEISAGNEIIAKCVK